jgi:hypothetical protein
LGGFTGGLPPVGLGSCLVTQISLGSAQGLG